MSNGSEGFVIRKWEALGAPSYLKFLHQQEKVDKMGGLGLAQTCV